MNEKTTALDGRIRGPLKGRGTHLKTPVRYHELEVEQVDDGWDIPENPDRPVTRLLLDSSRTVIARNQSPDVPFNQSINPYRGCEHGCIYCYARPTHAWLDLSPGLDFETKILHKPDAAQILRGELSKPGYQCDTIGIGTNTDAWQPVERKLGLTREILKVRSEFNHPVRIVTKSSGVLRDLDILESMARRNLVVVNVSVTTMDPVLNRTMEPRAASPAQRLKTIRVLADHGIPAGASVAPIVPVLNDHELEHILEVTREAGARFANYIFIRLPLEVSPLFRQWLDDHYPLKAEHIMNRIQDSRGGKDYKSGFGQRMRGQGLFARLIAERFQKKYRELGFEPDIDLSHDLFRNPDQPEQLGLF